MKTAIQVSDSMNSQRMCQTSKTCEDTAALLSSVLACWVVVCRTVYSVQTDSSIHVVFHIYEQVAMKESTELFITSLCSLFIIHSSCLWRSLYFSLRLFFTPLHHPSVHPRCHHCSSFLYLYICLSSVGPLLAFSCIYPPIYPPSLLFYIVLAPRPTLTYASISSSAHLSLYSPLQAEAWMERWIDRGWDGCMGGWVDARRKEGREEWQSVCCCNGY